MNLRNAALVAALVLAPTAARSAPPSVERLAALRQEVDALSEGLRETRRGVQDTLTSLRAERAELERQLRLEHVRLETLAALETERGARAEGLEDRQRAWRAPLLAAVEATRAHVERAVPFAREARLEALRKLRVDIEREGSDLAGALARLWRFIEDESALSREIGRARQPIELDGRPVLADVIHFGMATLYFRTPSDECGWARRRGDVFVYERLTGAEEELVAERFEDVEENRILGPRVLLLDVEVPR